nr:sorting nexin-11 isoform X1 [Misgurnus anguillicaudatus]
MMFWRVDSNIRSDESVGFSFYGFVKIFAFLWKTKDRKEKIICPLCRVTSNRMITSQEDEFIAVRVQNPRVQNEGSWNSYVDFKIFLHTNSKAFTAKTSCVRRRYSEFVWLKKKLQKNAGLVPVPDLPKKSLFTFINDDFIERRRKGLQSFLDRVLHMTVCLSDSQLHLFLQTQLPVKHIEDCVQGHTPYTVTDAILTYASSNRGWVQEEGEGSPELWSAPVPYESVESPAPHVPSLQCAGATSSGLEPLNEQTDYSDLETEQTAPDSKQGSGHEHILKEEECTINLMVEVHPSISYIPSVEGGSEETQKLDEKLKNLQGDGCEYHVTQKVGSLEVKHLQGDLDGVEAIQDMSVGKDVEITSIIEGGEKEAVLEQEYTVKQTFPDKDVPEKVISDLNAAQSDHNAKDLQGTTDKDCEPYEASVSVENVPDTKDQDKAEITIQENGDSSIDTAIQEDAVDETSCTHSEISECNEDHVDEVNKINAKCVHTGSAILILEGNEEAIGTQIDIKSVSTEISSEDGNLDANTADVNTLVLQAIEVDSMQCEENESRTLH